MILLHLSKIWKRNFFLLENAIKIKIFTEHFQIFFFLRRNVYISVFSTGHLHLVYCTNYILFLNDFTFYLFGFFSTYLPLIKKGKKKMVAISQAIKERIRVKLQKIQILTFDIWTHRLFTKQLDFDCLCQLVTKIFQNCC